MVRIYTVVEHGPHDRLRPSADIPGAERANVLARTTPILPAVVEMPVLTPVLTGRRKLLGVLCKEVWVRIHHSRAIEEFVCRFECPPAAAPHVNGEDKSAWVETALARRHEALAGKVPQVPAVGRDFEAHGNFIRQRQTQ